MSSKSKVTARIVELLQLVIASSVMSNERIARSMGLNVVDLQALGFIARHEGPMTAGEVSQQTELPTSTTTRVLDRLERQTHRAGKPAWVPPAVDFQQGDVRNRAD
ncbi:MAG TPA: helix-turn-helix domain-containing protein, partial [Agromyces sp.]|nr:helix-turn-helix domain-containing protein [Agromyces sp.]